MEYVIDLISKIDWFCNVMFQVCETVRLNVLDIACIASDQVIYADDFVAFFQEQVAKV